MKKVAVIGAGISGAICARELTERGFKVEVFEKSRGPGGRMATRRISNEDTEGSVSFDHGAPYFRARSRELQHELQNCIGRHTAAPWKFTRARIDALQNNQQNLETESVFVGTPGMNSICKDFLGGVEAHYGAEVLGLERVAQSWTVVAKVTTKNESAVQHFQNYDHIVLTAPAPQALKFLAQHSAALTHQLEMIDYAPCWAVMAFWKKHHPGLDAWEYLHSEGPLSWVGRNSSKPERRAENAPEGDSWVLHGSPEWSKANLEASPEHVVAAFLECALPFIRPDLTPPQFAVAHRWRYSLVTKALDKPFLSDKKSAISICGDGMLGGKVEAAFLSGLACGQQLPLD